MTWYSQAPLSVSSDKSSVETNMPIRYRESNGNYQDYSKVVSRFIIPSNSSVSTSSTPITLTVDSGLPFRIPAGTFVNSSAATARKLLVVMGIGMTMSSPCQGCSVKISTVGGILLWHWHIDARKAPGPFPSDWNSCCEMEGWAYNIGGSSNNISLRTHCEYRLTGYTNGQLIEPYKAGGMSMEQYPVGFNGTVDQNLVMTIQWDAQVSYYGITRTNKRFGLVSSSGDYVRTSRQGTSTSQAWLTASDMDVLKNPMRSIAYNNLIHIGVGTSGYISRSLDGINWTTVDSGTTQPF